MMCHRVFRRMIFVTGFVFLVMPSLLLAQGSPDIIWKRQVLVDRVNSVIFTSDGNTLISGGSDRLINLWRVSDGTLLQTLNTEAPFIHESAIESLSVTPNGDLLASCSYKVVQLWNLSTGTDQKLNGHTDWVVGVAFSPDGTLLASASFDTTVRIWRASDGALVKVLAGTGQQRCVAFSPDGSLIATTSADNSVKLWNTADWTLARTLSGHTDDVFTIAFSPDGSTLASGGYDDTVKLWNVTDGELKFTFSGNGGNVYSVAFTPDSTRVAFTDGEGSTIKIYRVADGALIRTFNSEVNEVQSLAFSSDGLLGYGRVDETVVLARINTSSSARISSPATGTTYKSPANITIVASPSKSGIVKMEFFQNGIFIGEDLTSPFTFNWNDVAAGTYSLSVVDTDNLGATTESGPVNITVVDQTNSPPVIAITSPAGGTTFAEPATITIMANASASAGVAKVEFLQDGISLGEDTRAPFTMLWNSVPMGNYSLTAVVTDNDGATATSDPIHIIVGEAPPETVKPRVSIASPGSKARLTIPDVTITGTASDNIGVAQVLYSLNSEPFRPAHGTERWEAGVTLVPGVNEVQVKSVDTVGNESTVLSRSFTYVVSAALGLTINGLGTVSPFQDGQILEVGKTYSISARPSIDSVFNGWTGTVTTNATKFSFVMTDGMSLTANFISNPFAETMGTYMGLIQSPTPSHERSGFIKITTTKKGSFSGKITLGNKNLSLNGRFNGDGSFTGTHTQSQLVLNLTIDLENDSDQITGSLSDDNFSSPMIADRSVYNAKTNPAPQSGKYTILIPPNSSEGNSPQGDGFGILKVDASGKTRLAGSLADGTKFSQGASLSKNGDWPLHASLYKRNGSISGPIKFRDQTSVSDLDGTVNWFRPSIAKAKIFGNGFTTQAKLIGSAYSRADGEPVLAVPPGEQNVVVNLGAGDLDAELQKSVTLALNNQFVVSDSGEEKLRLSVSPSSGALRGSFVHPVTGRTTRHNGVVFQKQNLAEGYFLGAEQSGFVSVIPADSGGILASPDTSSSIDDPVLDDSPVIDTPVFDEEILNPDTGDTPLPKPGKNKRD